MNKELVPLINHIVATLVAGRYQQLVDESQEKRLCADDITAVIAEHGRLTLPPSGSEIRQYVAFSPENTEVLVDHFLWVNGSLSDLMVRIVAYKPLSEGKFSLWDIYAP
ncbi:DUF7668 domain-containing protein [Hymenobacter aquaticus]